MAGGGIPLAPTPTDHRAPLAKRPASFPPFRKVAVKRLHALDGDSSSGCGSGGAAPGASQAAFKQFFEREIAILASIRHPNVRGVDAGGGGAAREGRPGRALGLESAHPPKPPKPPKPSKRPHGRQTAKTAKPPKPPTSKRQKRFEPRSNPARPPPPPRS